MTMEPTLFDRWIPKEGMILRHIKVGHHIKVIGRRMVGDMAFWEVRLHRAPSDQKSAWLIHEPWFLEQYEPSQHTGE